MARVKDPNDTAAAVVPPYLPGMQPTNVMQHIANSMTSSKSSKGSSTGSSGSTGAGATFTGGGSGGGFSAGGQFGASVGPVPDLNSFLAGDPTYQQQLAALNRALSDYQAQMQQNQSQYNVDYAGRTKDLGFQRQQGQTDLGNDYASRGLYESGLQATALGDLLDQFARRQSDLDTAKANFFANSARDYGNFQQEQNLSEQKAKQDAMARRSAQFGV